VPFVEDFNDTAVGPVPRVSTTLAWRDWLGTARVRLGLRRNGYKVAPGLYCVNRPDRHSPVLVTANYKLSFDALRRELAGIDAWLLVLDTRGINVWCAAGKKNFCTAEVVYRVKKCGLERLVEHRTLILPQLAAPGVAAHEVRKSCGFAVLWGPIRAADLPDYLRGGQKATEAMRLVTFTLAERLILAPVELAMLARPALPVLAAIFLLSGLSPRFFSIDMAWQRGLAAAGATLAGIVAGAVVTPALLPWLPGRPFYLKGLVAALAVAFLVPWLWGLPLLGLETPALLLLCLATSSYLAMNFTGATPFTSPSGVEKEMRRAIPVQAGLLLLAIILWVAAPFMG
jgi:hypothetical protein